MNEERKRNGSAFLSEIYNSSLKAGIDSPHRSHLARVRSNWESEGSQSSSAGRERSRSGSHNREGEGEGWSPVEA
ncbi:unnamed protein product [Linum trigynum]|uniref:Uncharacterized protein n=1 Tax=Linum trigynum TaxID=586398 RepID=A0AAV2CHI1_9ROSI